MSWFHRSREHHHSDREVLLSILETLEEIRDELRPKPAPKPIAVRFTANGQSIFLQPNQENHMTTPLSVGQTANFTIEVDDQFGQPMPGVKFDQPPNWSQTNSAVGTFQQAPDELSATLVASAVGDDEITVTVVIGGVTLVGSDDIPVGAPAPVPTTVKVIATVQ